ncbi:uncharacterized protein LOC127932048 isoform X39 [Oncorhynchus keta]|uniref:uncharacterized protein LOC127932048 isoform X38 n=1 Tax=Oncorhynchus keta TaxID=8018 RepID=UPI00227C9B43|nr:uncharacterized protein LOC127932048 isoform X38 [Oncorhynchus keta]XP_052382254.1 uncharacterized protein LOC127932048 isoform X39 [Oncorhynchus keta]
MDPGLVPGTGEKPLYQAGLHGPRSGSWDWRETTVSGWTTWTPGLVPGTGEKPLYQAGLHGPQVWFLGLERNHCIRLDYMDPRSGSWDWRETTVSGWTTWTPGLVPGTGEKPLYQAGLHGPQVWFLGLERNHCIRLDYMDPRSGSWDWRETTVSGWTTWTQVWFLGLERNHCIRLDYMDPRSGSWDWRETTVSGWTTWTPGLVPGTGEKPLYQAGLHGPQVWFLGLERNHCIRLDYMDPRSGSWDWRETTVSGWTTWTPGLVPGTGEKPLYQAGLHVLLHRV